ncbi:MAG: transposase [Bacteroidetes bacterium]|nr:transposase [Bacteroidota bacterium]
MRSANLTRRPEPHGIRLRSGKAQWQRIKLFFARQTFRKHTPRHIADALLYLSKTGCQWRLLPVAYPPWQTVYYHFHRCPPSVAESDPGCGRR